MVTYNRVDGSCRLYRYLFMKIAIESRGISRRARREREREREETLYLPHETNKSFSVLSPKKRRRTHTLLLRMILARHERRVTRGGGGGWKGGQPYSKVFRELKQISRTWWIRLLVRASKTRRLLPLLLLSAPSSSSSSTVSAIRSILGFTYRRRNCECRRPCNCESPKENGNFPPEFGWGGRGGARGASRSADDGRALTGSELSIEISIT